MLRGLTCRILSKLIERFFLQTLSLRGIVCMPSNFICGRMVCLRYAFLLSAKMHAPFQHTVGNHAPVEVAWRHGASAFFMARLCCAIFYLGGQDNAEL